MHLQTCVARAVLNSVSQPLEVSGDDADNRSFSVWRF